MSDDSDDNPQLFKNFMKVLCNANTSEGFRSTRDVSIPEIYLEFGTLGPPHQGQPANNRPILAFFGGREHGHIRKFLLKHWKDKDSDVQVHEYLPEGPNYTIIMGQTKYCLCPSGFEVASPRIVEAIYMGCVPVIINLIVIIYLLVMSLIGADFLYKFQWRGYLRSRQYYKGYPMRST